MADNPVTAVTEAYNAARRAELAIADAEAACARAERAEGEAVIAFAVYTGTARHRWQYPLVERWVEDAKVALDDARRVRGGGFDDTLDVVAVLSAVAIPIIGERGPAADLIIIDDEPSPEAVAAAVEHGHNLVELLARLEAQLDLWSADDGFPQDRRNDARDLARAIRDLRTS